MIKEKKTNQNYIWKGNPSHWIYFWRYALVIILAVPTIGISLIYGLYIYLKVRTTTYTLTSESLTSKFGVFSRETHELMLYRVQDVVRSEPFILRLVNRSNIKVLATDKVDNEVDLLCLQDGEKVFRAIRKLSEKARDKKGVRAIDIVRDN
jgi:uncharacterized membrane protein YdbT with pleckstrin-like domain